MNVLLFFFPSLFFLRKLLACSKGTDISVRIQTDYAVQVCKCHGAEQGVSQLAVQSHNQTVFGKMRHQSPPKDSGSNWMAPTSTKWLSGQWNLNDLRSRRGWHRSGWQTQTFGCQIGTITYRGIAAESLGSLFLIHNTCVHSFAYFAGVFRKPCNIPQTKKLNCFQLKNLLNIYKLKKQKACNLSLLQIIHSFSSLRAIFTFPTFLSFAIHLLCLLWSSMVLHHF